jgi:hypothetical protein
MSRVHRDKEFQFAYHGRVHDLPESAMLRILLLVASTLAACTPSSQKAAMPSPRPALATTVQSSSKPAVVAKGAVPGPLTDSPAEALGRRILSTAFVRVGPHGHLTVELHGGRTLVLRGVVMRPKDYCGAQVAGDPARGKYCGGYAEVAAARPGGAPAPDESDLTTPNPARPARGHS